MRCLEHGSVLFRLIDASRKRICISVRSFVVDTAPSDVWIFDTSNLLVKVKKKDEWIANNLSCSLCVSIRSHGRTRMKEYFGQTSVQRQ